MMSPTIRGILSRYRGWTRPWRTYRPIQNVLGIAAYAKSKLMSPKTNKYAAVFWKPPSHSSSLGNSQQMGQKSNSFSLKSTHGSEKNSILAPNFGGTCRGNGNAMTSLIPNRAQAFRLAFRSGRSIQGWARHQASHARHQHDIEEEEPYLWLSGTGGHSGKSEG